MFSEFLDELKAKNITIEFVEGKLKYSGPEQYINEELKSKLKTNKTKLLKHFWPKECPNMIPVNTEGALTPLVFMHAGEYFKISEYLNNNHPFYALFYVGSETEKIRHKTVQAFADEYLRQLLNILPQGPFYLGGMSFGGVVAYEMAIKLIRMGHEVPLLILGDCGIPAYENPHHYQFFQRCYKLLGFVYMQCIYSGLKLKNELFPSMYFRLSISKRFIYMVMRWKEIMEKYKPTTEFKGETLLFRASENKFNAEYLGWEKICKNITLVPFRGTHGSLFNDKAESVNIIKTHVRDKLKEIENKKNKP